MKYLSNFTDNLTYAFNQRSEGHGISNQYIPENIDLLIIVDSSTNEIEECERLKNLGIDIVIFDHHICEEINEHAIIVNPQLDNYPNKELSGSGLAYKACEVLDNLLDVDLTFNYIDLAGIGIYADVMSMKEPENRYFVYQALNNIKNFGIKAILKKMNIFIPRMTSQDIGFSIAPVINATARMNQIEKVIHLLLEDDFEKCLLMAKDCIKLNSDRKRTEVKLFNKIKDRIDYSNEAIIVVTTEEDKIDKGFQGLLAMKIAEYYKKPTLVVKKDEDICRGSGRGISSSVDFKQLLNDSGEVDYTGGHPNAFGVEFKFDRYDNIIKKINKKLKGVKSDVVVSHKYDIELPLQKIDFDLVKKIQEFNLLAGKDAPQTTFLIKNVPIKERQVMGKMFDTIKLKSDNLDLMKFRANEFYGREIKAGSHIDVIGSININEWYNFGQKKVIKNLQCIIDDYKIGED